MTAEELIKNLEYTEKKHKNDIVNTFDTNISMMCTDILRVLKNCIYIPNGATNGDMIKAVFPNYEIEAKKGVVWVHHLGFNGGWQRFLEDWWNEKYKSDEKEKNEK